jgi:hypothetical protein
MAETGGPPKQRRNRPRRPGEDGFWPIKQVGVANSIGFPLMLVGVLIGFVAGSAQGDTTMLWWLAGGLFVVGTIIAASNKVV